MRDLHKTLSKHILADGLPLVMDLAHSQGSFLKDINGDGYLDMFSMFASSAVGYNHPHIVARQEELGKLAINKPAMSDIYPQEYAKVLETFSRVAIPDELPYCFFIDGGALAVENALKAAFDWKTRLNMANGITIEASQVVHFKQAFHGRSGYTLSLTNTEDPRKYMYFPKFDWPRIMNPKLNFPLTKSAIEMAIEKEQQAIEQIEIAIAGAPHKVACIIIEPIQAEGGDNHFRKEFFHALRAICDTHDILLIMDEVQTGLGMTGKMWAYQHADIVPDLIAFGKKTQICGILGNKEKFDRVEKHVFRESSRINSTFGGNLIDMARLQLILEIIENEKLVANAEKMGDYLLQKVYDLERKKHYLSNARGLGLMVAIDFATQEQRDEFIIRAMNNRLLILGCGERGIRFRPHLNVNKGVIDEAISLIEKSLP
ncbi:L-lysine 6-transaminase [Sphingobacterium deserti]|uniref:L-lysine-epsilon aminotransferase n=1 Tax=Sphingobacterium deserti TaxID=1229276 RepID=A0A0B8T0T3_9SPHI|nr:L-lysine 6-transaminase [Sphingobacterium deserti]KGE14086.1 L-lysine 6-transaminase [Sphingobacterium deserti]